MSVRRSVRLCRSPKSLSQPTELDSDGSDIDLAQLLAQLPERQRFAVIYHYLGGLPYAEVAAVIGGSPEAARRAAADGIAKLRTSQGHNGPQKRD